MPGLAITDEFMLGTATVMIGPQADLLDLNVAENSIGLVKNFTFTSEPAYTELTQGVKNTVVASVMTSNPVRATMEAYEYTAKNLMYALGLEGADDAAVNTVTTTTSGATTDGATDIDLTSATGIVVGDYIMILHGGVEADVTVRKVTAVDTNTVTVAAVGVIPSGATVKKVTKIGVGSKEDQPYYSAKVIGVLASGERVVMHIGKIRIVKGFSMAFSSDNFGNLPIEFTLYDLVSTDPFYSDFGGEQAQLFRT